MNNNEKIKKKAYEDLLDDIKRSYMVIKIICIVCCILFLFGTVFCIINIVNVNGTILPILFCMIISTLVSVVLIILSFKEFKFQKNRLMDFKKQYQKAINNGYKDGNIKIKTETITSVIINGKIFTYDEDDIKEILEEN
ncbi:hypothetical protein [Agathobacter rectalis]|jgi:hypothetical protein|uniref:hypothetical protein n=1 Tax=Agathobacter rectalis TaxID=39491 RepID=UPI0027D2B872|nr:hypothetical protein [Agathobacter rectalis]MCB7108757.1 hypothetical protein [Agathobacter rectalis]MCG4812050.1 hypothetical protein [Agathobacter rectalis]